MLIIRFRLVSVSSFVLDFQQVFCVGTLAIHPDALLSGLAPPRATRGRSGRGRSGRGCARERVRTGMNTLSISFHLRAPIAQSGPLTPNTAPRVFCSSTPMLISLIVRISSNSHEQQYSTEKEALGTGAVIAEETRTLRPETLLGPAAQTAALRPSIFGCVTCA